MAVLGHVANPRPVATIKTGRVRMHLWLVARRDQSWLWRPVFDLQCCNAALHITDYDIWPWPMTLTMIARYLISIIHYVGLTDSQQSLSLLGCSSTCVYCLLEHFLRVKTNNCHFKYNFVLRTFSRMVVWYHAIQQSCLQYRCGMVMTVVFTVCVNCRHMDVSLIFHNADTMVVSVTTLHKFIVYFFINNAFKNW